MSALSDEQMKEAYWKGFYSDGSSTTDGLRAVADAAIAADRAARAEPIAWATPAGIAAIHAARLGRADNVQVPLSTYPGGDHSVAVYTAPPAAPVVTTEEGRHCGDPDCVPCRDPADPAAPFVPEGWKMVPVEPTEEMLESARLATESEGLTTTTWLRDCVYRAMLAAAPAPSQEPTT